MASVGTRGEQRAACQALAWTEHEEGLCEVFRLLANPGRMRIVYTFARPASFPWAS